MIKNQESNFHNSFQNPRNKLKIRKIEPVGNLRLLINRLVLDIFEGLKLCFHTHQVFACIKRGCPNLDSNSLRRASRK